MSIFMKYAELIDFGDNLSNNLGCEFRLRIEHLANTIMQAWVRYQAHSYLSCIFLS